MDSIEQLKQLALKFRDDRDWKQFHTMKDMALSLLLESSELAEHMQWRNDEDFKKYLATNREAVADELSDVLYWVLLLSSDLDINLPEAFKLKMLKNEEKYPVETARGVAAKYTSI